jgi:redox-sensing transcriptional repressor
VKRAKIPAATVGRLSTYGRVLIQLEEEGVEVASSAQLATRCGLNPAQIRKDLAYFGEFGIRGVGYRVKELKDNLKDILGVTKVWKVALVGAGNLGSALVAYRGFLAHGFQIDAIFDKFPAKCVLSEVDGPEVLHVKEIKRVIPQRGIRIGIVAVPQEGAQSVVDLLVEAGVQGILNFAPIRPSVPALVKVKNVDLGSELESLSFYLSKPARG